MGKKAKENKKNKADKVNTVKLNAMPTRVVYWVFEVLIVLTLGYAIVMTVIDRGDKTLQANHISHIMLCVGCVLLYNLPLFAQKSFKLYIPAAIHIFILIFIFAHFILGEVLGIYKQSTVFDKILHATSGLAIAIGGFSLVNILNRSSNLHMKLSPLLVAVFSFCFALAIALLWEILEFSSDCLFGTNMQRYIPPKGYEPWLKQDYGLIDTMGDVIVSTCSALVVCVLGYIVLRKKANYLNRFLIRKISDYDTAINEAREAGDEKLAAALEKAKAEAIDSEAEPLSEPVSDVEPEAAVTLDMVGEQEAESDSAAIKEQNGQDKSDEPNDIENSEPKQADAVKEDK